MYGLEITSGAKLDKIIAKANVVRRQALRTIMHAPMGKANEILQIDAGWCRIETLIAARKVKMVKRVMNKEQTANARRILIKAATQNTEWTTEVERIMRDKVIHANRH